MECTSAGKHFEAAKPLVKDIAEATLSGGFRMDFAKEKSFMNYVKSIISPDVEPERIKLLQKASKAADDTVGENSFYVDNFVRSETPIPQIEANIFKSVENVNLATIIAYKDKANITHHFLDEY